MIRAKAYDEALLAKAPEGFPSAPVNARGYPDKRFTLQIAVEDCTGCGICIDHCPAHDPLEPGVKAINLGERLPLVEAGRRDLAFFELRSPNTSGNRSICICRAACNSCDRYLSSPAPAPVAAKTPISSCSRNCSATACKSRTRPAAPRSMAAISLRCRGAPVPTAAARPGTTACSKTMPSSVSACVSRSTSRPRWRATWSVALNERIGPNLANEILGAPQRTDSEIMAQRARVDALRQALAGRLAGRGGICWLWPSISCAGACGSSAATAGPTTSAPAGSTTSSPRTGTSTSLVLDTEVYSNTGGQSSKATPLAARPSSPPRASESPRKDLALQAIAYGYVYVAQIALGGSPEQTIQALRDAEAYDGPSLILAYSHCIAHGIDMRDGMNQQRRAVASGYWPLIRFDPTIRQADMNPFRLDSTRPRLRLEE